jgi:hypothetical protein
MERSCFHKIYFIQQFLLQFTFKVQAPLKLPCETNIDYPGNNQHI